MGVEEFGSVYESLLELVPVIGADLRTFSFAGEDESAGNARKTSGSYYTPDSLVQQLLDTTLEPVVADRMAAQPEQQAQAILNITVVDPACGSGHFLLGAARRLAGHLARVRAGGTPGAAEYRHALRDVVTHCIHGVDRNPMAIELARMALWLEAYTSDRALGFLDHHLVCGDALLGLIDLKAVGAGIPDEAFKALTGDDKDVAKIVTKLNREARRSLESEAKRGQLSLALGTETLAQKFAALDALADDGLESVAAKRAQYAALRAEAEQDRLALAADLFVGAFLVPKQLAPGQQALTEQQAAQRFPTTASVRMALEGTLGLTHPVATATRQVCVEARVFHWPLAFPQVFAKGGFDVVLGNPPWDMLQADPQEYFSTRAPHITAAVNQSERDTLISRLQTEAPSLFADWKLFEAGLHRAQAFIHAATRFEVSAAGRLNLAALFTESALHIRSDQGLAGLVVPSSIATDSFNQKLFRRIADGQIVSLFDFENRRRLFRDVHAGQKFTLLTLGVAERSLFGFFLHDPSQVRDRRKIFELTRQDLSLINPNSGTCPVFRAEEDARITSGIYSRVPVLQRERKAGGFDSDWGVTPSLMFMMNEGNETIRTVPASGDVPLYEGKMVAQYDHRAGTYAGRGDARGYRVLPSLSIEQYRDSECLVKPYYWVDEDEVRERVVDGWDHEWFLGFKDVTSATNERTVLASIIPFAGAGHTLPILFASAGPRAHACLLANLNSLVLDYVARQKIGGLHLSFMYFRQLPILPPAAYSPKDEEFVASRVLELTYSARDLAGWAVDLGHSGNPFVWDPDRRSILRAELDAWYAGAYGLSRDELRYVLSPEDTMGSDYPSETFRGLKQNEEREFGEYRTRRLVLEAWDRLFA
jgi:hypothetical protein